MNNEKIKGLIRWKAISTHLAGNKTSIRSNYCPKKYEAKVKDLLKRLEGWVE